MTTTTARRRSRLAVLAAAGAIALAGCSGSEDAAAPAAAEGSAAQSSAEPSAAPTELVAQAVASSTEASSASFTLESQTTAAGQDITVTGQGQFDSATGAVSLDMSTTVPEQGEIAIQVLQVDGTAYLSGIPGLPAEQWVEIPLDQLSALSGGADLGGTDPTQQLQLLQQVSDDVAEDGTSDVNGVETTRYTGTIDLDAAAEQAEDQGAGDAAQLQEAYTQLGLTSIPFELYIDGEGLPARLTSTVEADAEGESISSTLTVDFTDWGTDVEIVAPENTVPLEELAGGMGMEAPATPAG